MRNFVQPGKTVTVTVAESGGVLSGALMVVGALIGVAAFDAAMGEEVEIETEGVFTLPKAVADDISAGDLLYWDAGNGNLTKTAGSGSKPLVGAATADAAAATTTVRCKLGVHGITGAA